MPVGCAEVSSPVRRKPPLTVFWTAPLLCWGPCRAPNGLGPRRMCCSAGWAAMYLLPLGHLGFMCYSFVPTECSGGRGMWGIFRKPLKRAFRRCMGWGGGGGRTIFFRKLSVTIDGLGVFFLFWSGFIHTALHPYPLYCKI